MISIRLSEKAEKQLKELAEFHGVTVSEFVRNIINEKLEDMYDIELAEQAYEEYLEDKTLISHEEVMKMFGVKE